ncbi:trigger factor [Abyssicoccus albus]|uniref:Trigger factor n=1 Tax=Abyssicoccus albus TaxID=1817405 RepID=A0A3N5C632_9BACL|nr:trigger factor [Abyssicoccus albus]RPF57768.1 trigger factor [Abyssicoccus albus]
MTAQWEKKEGNVGTLTVTVPSEKLDEALDQAFKKVVKQVEVPGFRKGKMPRKMFEQRFGVESLYQDALDIILPATYPQAIDEVGINPVAQPEVDIEQMEQGKDLIYVANVTVEPEVELGEYKGLTYEKKDDEVTDQEIQDAINAQLERKAELELKEDGAIEEGNVAVIDFDGYVDGEQFEGGQAEGYELEIGSGSFIPGFEEQLVGVKSGDEKDVVVTFPEEYHAENLAGKEATFKVKVHDIKEKNVPELTDELAKELNQDADSVQDYKEKLAEEMKTQKAEANEAQMKEELVVKATDNTEIDIPEAMVETELNRMLQEFEQRLAQQGMNLELYSQLSGQDTDQLKEQMKGDAKERVKTNLVLRAISDAENIEVTEEAMNEELTKMSEQFGISVEDIKSTLGDLSILENDLKVQKAIDVIVDNAKAE